MSNLSRQRVHVPSGFYYVTLRARHRRELFSTDQDRRKLETIVADARARTGVDIAAYCWLERELHFIIRVHETPLGRFVQRISSQFARYRLQDVPRQKHLFEERHTAELLTLTDIPTRLRELHQLPQQHHLTTDPSRYPWSSLQAEMRKIQVPWLNLNWLKDNPLPPDEAAAFALPDEKLLNRIVVAVAHKLGIEPKLLRGHEVRSQKAACARALVTQHAMQHGFTQEEMARRFNLDASTLSGAIKRYRRSRAELFALTTNELLAEPQAGVQRSRDETTAEVAANGH